LHQQNIADGNQQNNAERFVPGGIGFECSVIHLDTNDDGHRNDNGGNPLTLHAAHAVIVAESGKLLELFVSSVAVLNAYLAASEVPQRTLLGVQGCPHTPPFGTVCDSPAGTSSYDARSLTAVDRAGDPEISFDRRPAEGSPMIEPELPRGLTPEAKAEQARFFAAMQAMWVESRKISLTILVWGPGPTRTDAVARKRREIRDRLLEEGHYAVFSEDIPRLSGLTSAKDEEFIQARTADLIIALVGDSRGALGEVHDFAIDPTISPRMMVMAPSAEQTSYSAQGAFEEVGRVIWYAPDAIDRCQVLTEALRAAEGRRQRRFRRQMTGADDARRD
jgi:hypothetical protein